LALKILVVDDEPAVLELFRMMVAPWGCEVETMVDSREAAWRLTQEKFDGIFVDARMPHVDGFQLTARIRSSPLNRHVPVVMLTGLDDAETMRKGFNAGISFFLGKPFTREKVYALINAARGSMLREKRRFSRLPFRTTVNCTWGPHAENHFMSGSFNIGEGGMLLGPSGGLDVGQELDLQFQIPANTRTFRPHARVVRRETPDRIAVEFMGLSERDLSAIQEYISARVRD
jgi:CheY-like chemotaxis protein